MKKVWVIIMVDTRWVDYESEEWRSKATEYYWSESTDEFNEFDWLESFCSAIRFLDEASAIDVINEFSIGGGSYVYVKEVFVKEN